MEDKVEQKMVGLFKCYTVNCNFMVNLISGISSGDAASLGLASIQVTAYL